MVRGSERHRRSVDPADHRVLRGRDETRPDLVQGVAQVCLSQLRGGALLQAAEARDDRHHACYDVVIQLRQCCRQTRRIVDRGRLELD